ncbi:MAG: hypothetical protein IJ364_05195 [Oscillospiraceae bacterium]|nr:hypothetical protein [Oscillospiraceae bacterium]
MWKKILLCCLSLSLLLLSSLRLGCTLSINGRQLEGVYAPKDIERAELVALAAAEELLSGHAMLPEIEKSWSLSIIPPMGGRIFACDALLSACPGVKKGDGVYVNGVFLGTVADGKLLKEKTREFISSQMPNAAVFGSISGELEIATVYTRKNHDTNYEDMLLLISGMAPVVYTDEYGRIC